MGPKCQAAAAKEWLAARQAELLPVPYCHVVFTLPRQIADIAYQNKAEIYGILFRAAAETLLTIAADPKHLGARIGLTAVLHSWGSAMPPREAPRYALPMSISSCRAAASLSMVSAGSLAGRASSCTCACSPCYSSASSWKS
jgi:hypothetical protein